MFVADFSLSMKLPQTLQQAGHDRQLRQRPVRRVAGSKPSDCITDAVVPGSVDGYVSVLSPLLRPVTSMAALDIWRFCFGFRPILGGPREE